MGAYLQRAALGPALISIILACEAPSPSKAETETGRLRYVATIPPVAAILREIVADRGQVNCLLQPGASPHTYDPSPSDAATAERCAALFWVDPMLDGWVTSLEAPERIALFEMVPEKIRLGLATDHHGRQDDSATWDPHFWTSPMAVKAILPALAERLGSLDPVGASTYEANAGRFSEELDDLHESVLEIMEPFAGEALLVFHPSFQYFTHDYGLTTAGVIEPSPGREPSPRYLVELMRVIEEHDVKAIFTEPQLPRAPGEMLSQETGLPLYVLDPLGGSEGRDTYTELILYNAEVLRDALGEE